MRRRIVHQLYHLDHRHHSQTISCRMKRALLVALVALLPAVMAEVYYAPDVEAGDITDSNGAWTVWFNNDIPLGTGEFEDVVEAEYYDKKKGTCDMFCKTPIAMEVKPVNPDHVWTEISMCTVQNLNPTKGYRCGNADNREKPNLPDECKASYCAKNNLNSAYTGECARCPDITVRYYCQGNKEELVQEKCGLNKRREEDRRTREMDKQRMMADLAAQDKREQQETGSLKKLLRKLMKDLEA